MEKGLKPLHGGLSWAIRKPGEKIDLLFGADLSARLQGLLGRDDAKLLWATEDRDWRTKLNSIVTDEDATSAPRDHLLSLKRLNTSRETMELIVDAIRHDELLFKREPLDSLNQTLRLQSARRLQWYLEFDRIGKESSRLLPYVFAWFQSCRQTDGYVDTHDLSAWSKSRTHLIEFGRPNLWHVIWFFRRNKKLKRMAFIAHLKKDESNDILIFERGKNWAKEQMDQRERARRVGKP